MSLAPWLTRTLAMFEATQWKMPLSSARSPVICRTPLGSNVYLLCRGVGGGTQLTSRTATGTISHRDTEDHTHVSQALSRCDCHQRNTLGLSKMDTLTIPALTKIIHSPFHRYTHEHQIWVQQATGSVSVNTAAETPPWRLQVVLLQGPGPRPTSSSSLQLSHMWLTSHCLCQSGLCSSPT